MMHMDEGEILREYRQAKNQKEQVSILADLNCVSKREMAQWLVDHGEKVDKRFFATVQRNADKGDVQAEPEHGGMKVYIAGPITGNPDYIIEFCEVENWLMNLGFEAVNPAKNAEGSYKAYIDTGLKQLMECGMICLLPGWQESDGASLEKAYADTVEMPELLIPDKVWARVEKMIKAGERQ